MVETLLIDSETVRSNIEPLKLVNQIEDELAKEYNGDSYNPAREDIPVENQSEILSMPARLSDGSIGIKWVSDFLDNEEVPPVLGTVIYNDKENGRPLAIIDGTELTRIRTGCAAVIGTKYLTELNPESIGIIGLGAQAKDVVKYHAELYDIKDIYISDIDESAYNNFEQMFCDSSFDIHRCDKTSCVKKADSITTATPATEPVIDSIDSPTHINALGADMTQKQEISSGILRDPSSTLVTDNKEQSKIGGEFSSTIQSGKVNMNDIIKLGHIIDDKNLMKQISSDITIFDSTGTAIQDIVSARIVYENVDKGNCESFEFF
jgi:alanine dehydrogenase